jgi:hypothetical protein
MVGVAAIRIDKPEVGLPEDCLGCSRLCGPHDVSAEFTAGRALNVCADRIAEYAEKFGPVAVLRRLCAGHQDRELVDIEFALEPHGKCSCWHLLP